MKKKLWILDTSSMTPIRNLHVDLNYVSHSNTEMKFPNIHHVRREHSSLKEWRDYSA